MGISQKQLDRFTKMGFTISLPYNHDLQLWEKVAAYKSVIKEVYAGFHPDAFPSLRIWNHVENHKEHMQNLLGLQKKLAADDTALNIILNSFKVINKYNLLFDSLKMLMSAGEVRVTVSDISLAEKLRHEFPDLLIEVSVMAGVDSQYSAMLWRDLVGAKVIVIKREKNKDIETIKQIKELGMTIKMVVVDDCTPNCPALLGHVNQLSSQTNTEHDLVLAENQIHYCTSIKNRLPKWHWVKKEVLPYNLPEYEGVLDIVKLIDRISDTAVNIKLLDSFIKMETNVHHKLGYKEKPDTFKKVSICNHQCASCDWCESHITLVKEQVLKLSLKENTKKQISDKERKIQKKEKTNFDDMDCLTSIKKLKAELNKKDQQGSHDMLKLLKFVLINFKNYISGGKKLHNNYKLMRLTSPFENAIGMVWADTKSSFTLAIVPPDYDGDVAFKTKHVCCMVLNNAGNAGDRFYLVEQELRWLLDS